MRLIASSDSDRRFACLIGRGSRGSAAKAAKGNNTLFFSCVSYKGSPLAPPPTLRESAEQRSPNWPWGLPIQRSLQADAKVTSSCTVALPRTLSE